MKTDRFSDIIRRKLESIRPEFTDKDWARMQSTLQQAGPPQPGLSPTGQPFSGGVWAGKSWLLAAASVSTVALVAYSIWQRSEINHLQQTIGQLKQQTTTKQTAPAPADQDRPTLSKVDTDHLSTVASESSPNPTGKEELATTTRHDTVFITRYVPAPEIHNVNPVGDRAIQKTEISPEQRYATASRAPVVGNPLRQSNNLSKRQKSDSYGVSSTPLTIDNTQNNPSETTANPSATPPKSSVPPSLNEPERRVGIAKNQRTKGNYVSPVSPGNSVSNPTGTVSKSQSLDDHANAATQQELTPTEQAQVAEQSGVSASYELATSRPLATESINWNALLAQRAKRMRPVRTTSVPVTLPTQAPESKRIEPAIARFRAGIGGEFEPRMWSAGIFSEIPVGKHVMIGVGLSQATYLSGLFITANDFSKSTKRNFDKEFGGDVPLDPKLSPYGDIINIDTRMVRVQIPLSLGYRIPLTRSLTFVPNVGTYMVLSNKEKVTFNYRQMIYGMSGRFDQASLSKSHPTDLFNNVALSLGLELQKGRFVVQGSPVLTLPTCAPPTQPGPNWQENTVVGLRARLLYQF